MKTSFLQIIILTVLAVVTSSCTVSVNGHPVAGIGVGGPGGHGRSQCGHPGGSGGYRPPSGLRCMKGVPPGCREISRGGHRIVCDPRGRDIGFLRPQGGGGYGGGGYAQQGGGYRQGGYSSGGYNGGYGGNNQSYRNSPGPAYGPTRGYGQGSGYQPGQYAGNDRAGRPTYLHGYVGEDGFTPTGAHPR